MPKNGNFRSKCFRKIPVKIWYPFRFEYTVVLGRFSCSTVKSLAGFSDTLTHEPSLTSMTYILVNCCCCGDIFRCWILPRSRWRRWSRQISLGWALWRTHDEKAENKDIVVCKRTLTKLNLVINHLIYLSQFTQLVKRVKLETLDGKLEIMALLKEQS